MRNDTEKKPLKKTKEAVEIGKRIASLRDSAGYTQEEFAEKAELSLSGLRKIEQGTRSPYPSTINKICKALGIDRSAIYNSPEESEAVHSNLSSIFHLLEDLVTKGQLVPDEDGHITEMGDIFYNVLNSQLGLKNKEDQIKRLKTKVQALEDFIRSLGLDPDNLPPPGGDDPGHFVAQRDSEKETK